MANLNGKKVAKASLHGPIHLGPYGGQIGPAIKSDSFGTAGSVVLTKCEDGLHLECTVKGVQFEAFVPNGNIQSLVFEKELKKADLKVANAK